MACPSGGCSAVYLLVLSLVGNAPVCKSGMCFLNCKYGAGGVGAFFMEHMLTLRKFSNSPPTHLAGTYDYKSGMKV